MIPGIPYDRYMLRDYYLAVACEICGVTPLEVMQKSHSHHASTARHAVLYAIYTMGGITLSCAGAMMGLTSGCASTAISQVSHRLQYPKRYPLLNNVINAFNLQ